MMLDPRHERAVNSPAVPLVKPGRNELRRRGQEGRPIHLGGLFLGQIAIIRPPSVLAFIAPTTR